MTSSASTDVADVIVVGGGIVGLAAARALARAGASVLLSAPEHEGTATSAAAGVLCPTLDPHPGTAFDFACAARDAFPSFSTELHEETGIDVQLSLNGVVRVALDDADAASLRAETSAQTRWIDAKELAELEPSLEPCQGARLHERDGIVANERVHAALRAFVRAHRSIRWSSTPVSSVVPGDEPAVCLDNGHRWHARTVVLAAGAWTPKLLGTPAALAVTPGRGQSISIFAPRLTRAVFAPQGYLTPRRDGRVFVGATLESVGFDTSTTEDAVGSFRRLAKRLLGPAGDAEPLDRWAGIRPMTEDKLHLLGRDPRTPGVIYATGHSKNGILMGPLTGDVVVRLASGEDPGFDLTPMRPDRFG